NITNTIEVASSHSGTTAWAIQTSGCGIPSMLISIPLKYMHTNVEVAEISDIKAVSDLISAVIREGNVID
ncbi:MAG: M42 family peptidase, partial [Clostridia bacterium]|nr:M42 family peptidase [Clostridia bacterium]